MKKAVLVALAFACASGVHAAEQKYPTKPIRMISPFAPGGGTDLLGRAIAIYGADALGQPVVVDNRPGAGGAIGAETTARSNPDGYTLIIVSATYAGASAYRPPAYDPIRDITPISLIGTTALLYTVHPSLPVKTLPDLIAYAKANPGKLNFATVGSGSNVHLAMEMFKLMTQTRFVDIAYKGGGPAMTALIAGEVQVTAMSVVPSMPHVKSGRARPLAVSTAKRLSFLPDVPAVSEFVPGYEASHWYAMWGPKGLPRPIVTRWNEIVAKWLKTDEAQARLRAEGLEPNGGAPDEATKVIGGSIEKWRRVMREANIKPEN